MVDGGPAATVASVDVVLTGRFGLASGGVVLDGDSLGRLGRLLLACLVSERHRTVPRDELADVLWGHDPPRTWETSLRVVVSKVRSQLVAAGLPAALVATVPNGYRFVPGAAAVAVDVERAVRAVEGAEEALRAGRAGDAAQLAGDAAAVAARPFLGGEAGPWAERRQAELRALHLRALLAAADAALAAGDPAAALEASEEAVALEPFREAAHQRVMAAHSAAGNRAEALRAYERCRRLLVEELGVPPSGAVQAAYERLLRDDDAGRAGAPAARAVVPEPTSFVGRRPELAEVRRLLAGGRLLTLLGTGGVGKTRLARAATAGMETVLVELGAVSGAGAVAQEALAALGVRETAGLGPVGSVAASLAGRSATLILDNCEHVIDQSAELAAAVLRSAPGVRVLATSREPLRLAGEVTWPVPPLSTEDAMALFRERARAVRPDVDWQTVEPAVAHVCRRLDGIPLALELAAARTRSLSVDEIAGHLDDRFRLLTGGARDLPVRQQTLRAAVDWTYEALPAGEARLFDRLSVFAGTFPLEAAEQVCADGDLESGEVLVLLAGLVDRSLVLAEPLGPRTRYRLLETLRQYGAERLAASGDGPAVRDRHLAWAMESAARADRRLGGPEQAGALEELELAHDDVRAALTWAAQVSPEAALRLASDLGRFWEVRGHLTAGRGALESALAAAAPAAPSPARARALDWAGILAQQQGDYAEAAARFRASLAVHRELGHERGVAAGLHGLGNLAALRGDLAEAAALYEESLAMGRRSGDAEVQAAALTNLGSVAENRGDLGAARALFEDGLALRRRLGDEHAIALLTGNLGYVAFQEGDRPRARRLLDESLAIRRRLGDRAGTANALANLGSLALAGGDLHLAAAHLAASLELAEAVGDLRGATLARLRLARVARARGDLASAVELDRRAVPPVGHLRAARTIAEWLEGLAATSVGLGDHERAAALLGAAARLRSTIGAPVPAGERAAVADVAARAKSALGDDAFARAESAGATAGTAGVDGAVALAWRDMPGAAHLGDDEGGDEGGDQGHGPMPR